MPGRRRRAPPPLYSLSLELPGVAEHAAGAAGLLAAFVKHLAFAREQCHAPFGHLESLVAEHRQAAQQLHAGMAPAAGLRTRRLKSSTRKAIKYFDRLSSLLQLAGSIPFPCLEGRPVTLLLGSSVLRPREVYCLHFPAVMHEPGAPPPCDKALGEASRRLLRAAIVEHANIPEWDEAPGPTKMWLLFQAREGALAAPPPGFLAKRPFALNLRRAFQVTLNLSGQPLPPLQQQAGCAAAAQPAGGEAGGGCGMEADDGEGGLDALSQRMSLRMSLADDAGPPVWYQAAVHVKGLKPHTSGA